LSGVKCYNISGKAASVLSRQLPTDRQWAESRAATLYTQFCDLVVAQAKRIMDTNPGQSVKETAYELGFPDTANFCRYFKRATGIYPQAYKKWSWLTGTLRTCIRKRALRGRSGYHS